VKQPAYPPNQAALWRRRSLDVQLSDVVAGRGPGPEPPRPWARRLSQLIEASREPEPGPAWWTPLNAYFGSVETRTHQHGYYLDGLKRLGPRDQPVVFFQFTLAGFGHFESHGRPPQRIGPGKSFFAVLPSQHRYYLPEASPGWTFGWIGLYHPYLVRRLARQVASTGAVVDTPPNSPLISRALRLVRGAFRKDYRDRFAVERELFELTLAFERLAQQARAEASEPLLDDLRSRIVAEPRRHVGVEALAAEHGLSRSAFSHFFRARTGLSPARFMTEVRVQQAEHLLTTTRLTLERIARECGFANANHFGKVFRRFRQQSPNVYRQSIG
jgi:AraC-like DNA-binding protein